MDGGRSKGEDFQFQFLGPPPTPFRTTLPNTEPIRPEMRENERNQVNWLGLERYGPGFAQGGEAGVDISSFHSAVACSGLNGVVHDLEAASAGKEKIVTPGETPGIRIEQSFDGMECNLPFGHLLALADAASTEGFRGAAGRSFFSFPNRQFGSSHQGSSSASTLLPTTNIGLGSNFRSNGNYSSQNNVLAHHQCTYDLNFPPGTKGNAVSSMGISQFAPPTPAKVGGAENNHDTEEENLHANEKGQEENEWIDANRLQGPSQPDTDSSVLAVSTALKDNQNSEEGDQIVELLKTPQQKPRRRKHRPKVVREDKPKQTPKPVTPKPAASKENPPVKRKYVRKKVVIKPTTPPAEVNGDPADPKTLEPTKNSCRRALKFNSQGQQQDESSTHRSISNLDSESRAQDCDIGGVQSKSSAEVAQGIELIVEITQADIAYDRTISVSQLDGQVQCTSFQIKKNTSQETLDVGKDDQVTVHDKREDAAKSMMKNNTESAPRSPNDSNSCTSAVLTEEVQASRSKRKYSGVVAQASNTNRTGAHYNSLQAYGPCLLFPNIYKKKRSEKGQNSVASSTSCLSEMKNAMEPPKTYPFAPKANYWNSASQLTTGGVPAKLGGEDFEDKHQTMEYLLAFPHHERLTKRRSKTLTQVCDLASLNKRAECQMQPTYSANQGTIDDETQRVKNLEQSHKCLKALVADMKPTLAKRKRSKMRNFLTSSASYCTNKMQLHQQMVLYKYQQSFHKPSGARPKVIWQDFIDAVTEQFKYLDINRECDSIIYQERNALVPSNEDQNALVLYRSDGTIVPFQGPFDPIRKRRPRPKVELDDETNRVWRLLLENINNEGIDGTDEEKRRWWEEERRVFRGRADSFIARMHLVQGDRRFSRWKGSVVDSVIGVFLTQNVSDHLSSSAFMSLAARYPLKSEKDHNPFQEEEATLLVKEPEVCILDSEQTIEWKKQISNQPVCDQSSMTLHESEHNEEKEVVNSNVSPVINTVDTSLMDKTKCSSLNSSESDVEIYHTSTTRIETANFAQNRATNDAVSSQNFVNSSQNTTESSIAQTAKRVGSYLGANSENEENITRLEPNNLNCLTSFTELLKMAGSTMLHEVSSHRIENVPCDENSKDAHSTSEQSILTAESASQETIQEKGAVTIQESLTSYSENNQSSNLRDENMIIQSRNWFVGDNNAETLAQEQNNKVQKTLNLPNLSGETLDVTESTISAFDNQRNNKQKTAEDKALKEINAAKQKNRRVGREINHEFDWDTLRREAEANGKKREKTTSTMDSLDYEAVRCADVNEIAYTIKERGMNNMLAERIKAFLNRLVKDHGSIDLEWLRDISPDKAKEYLLSIRGLGLKSVECVRLLTLHHLAFPVDTNVGRIAVRLGWVPLQPLPESLQLHLLELYPVLESIQKYLWPRLCKLEQKQLYELHYQMITFGKVFCTKSKPNCNACPMRGECRHFASAFASARLALPAPAPEEKSIVSVSENTAKPDSAVHINGLPLPPPQKIQQLEGNMQLEASLQIGRKSLVGSCEPIIEEPASPEPESTQDPEHDIEDSFYDDPDDIPTIKLNMEEFTQNLQNYMERNMELQEGEMSKALVALTPEAASIPTAKLKNVSRLRTEHQVYELPDSHPLLEGMDKREPDDPCSYLLAIWTPGETANSIQPPEGGCSYQELGKLCNQKTCFACNSAREANSQLVRGTLLIPCRTAMRGSFPLNGTYFQVNEVFADHDSSLNPIDVPRSWIWNLPRRTVYFGTSVPSIFKGLPTEGIQHCFWRGYVCVRGFDQKTRAPRPLMARLHFPASKLAKGKGKTVDE